MAKLPLIINERRVKTLEELRDNFKLAELVERYQEGKLRAWLSCWDFENELKSIESLSLDLTDETLAEELCHIFQISEEMKRHELEIFAHEKQMHMSEMEQERKSQQAEQLAEAERQAEQRRPLTLDEIKWDWQETTLDFDLGNIIAGPDRFVAIRKNGPIRYSYDGLDWCECKTDREVSGTNIAYLNGQYVVWNKYNKTIAFSVDLTHWTEVEIDSECIRIHKLIWTGEQYFAFAEKEEHDYYIKTIIFIDKTCEDSWCRPRVYTAKSLSGPWYKEKLECVDNGDEFLDAITFDHMFSLIGQRNYTWASNKGLQFEFWLIKGSSITVMEKQKHPTQDVGALMNLEKSESLFTGLNKCFSDIFITKDGRNWIKSEYRIKALIEADRFLVAWIAEASRYPMLDKDFGIHVSIDGMVWSKLNTPFDTAYFVFQNGKLLLCSRDDKSKIAVGTLKL